MSSRKIVNVDAKSALLAIVISFIIKAALWLCIALNMTHVNFIGKTAFIIILLWDMSDHATGWYKYNKMLHSNEEAKNG